MQLKIHLEAIVEGRRTDEQERRDVFVTTTDSAQDRPNVLPARHQRRNLPAVATSLTEASSDFKF
jgi:hypothetical protein